MATRGVCTSLGRQTRFAELSWATDSEDSDADAPRQTPAHVSRASAADDSSLTRRHDGNVREIVLKPAYDLLPCHTITTVAARAAKRRRRVIENAPRRFRLLDIAPDSSDESDADDRSCSAREASVEDTASNSFTTCRDDRHDEASHRLQPPHDGQEANTASPRKQDVADSEVVPQPVSLPLEVERRSACAWLTRADYQVLTSCEGWLNDNIVNAYAELLNDRNCSYFQKQQRDIADAACDPPATGSGQDSRAHPSVVRPRKRTPVRTRSTRATKASGDASVMVEGGRRKTFVFGSFFYNTLSLKGVYDFSRVQRWTITKSWSVSAPAKPVLEYGKLLVPIHVHENHWVLAGIDLTYRRFVYMDSLLGGDTTGVIPTLRRWLIDELTDKYTADVVRLQEVPSWEVVINPPYVGRQKDGGSCGMFVLAHAEHLELSEVPTITQGDIPALREEAARCLREGILPL